MPPQASATASPSAPPDPARARGLRRARRLAPCPTVEPTPLPTAPNDIELLALLTRVRSARISQGELAAARLYDLRAFKTVWAELAYLHRLAAGGRHGGTVVTSIRQLVAGLAALHPAWKITGEGFEDRDRHHQAVRRRLRDLQAMGLLRWRVGVDEAGEERRTELELHPTPELTDLERAAAGAQLERWQARYGHELDTGSATGITAVKRTAAPLSASERQRRGCQRARARGAARTRGEQSQTNSAPPCGASATPQNNLSTIESNAIVRSACQRTRARANVHRTPSANLTPTAPNEKTASSEEKQPNRHDHSVWDVEVKALLERVAARQAARSPVLALIADQAQRRALELAKWGLERAWPTGRLREAWVVARYGQNTAADSGASAAGPLHGEDYARLRRAVARYERNRSARPDGFPEGGLAALLQIGSLASERAGPRTLRYAIGGLDQLSRRMRASASADSAKRISAAQRRAQNRRLARAPTSRLTFRLPGPRWPRWLSVDQDGIPLFSGGLPMIDPELAPPTSSEAYRSVIRDAYLIAGRQLPALLDGRSTMHLRNSGQIPPAERHNDVDRELVELAHRTGQPLATLAHVPSEVRAGILARLRATEARTALAQTQAFRQQIARAISPDRKAPQ